MRQLYFPESVNFLLHPAFSNYKTPMSDITDNSDKNETAPPKSDSESPLETPEKNSNHIAGCSIFLVILAMVIFLVSVSVYSYFDHKKAFIAFSQENITETEIAPTSDPTSTNALTEKFSNFSALVKDKKLASMTLSPQEINLAIAHFDKLAEFKKKLYVTGINNKHIEARASFPITAGFDGQRHFNGKLMLEPVIAQGSIFPIVSEAIADTGNPVPPKVLQAIPVLMFAGYRNDESIQDVFHKLTNVELKNGALHITSDPASTATPIIEMDVEEEASVGFQLFLLLTFIFITTVAFIVWYSKFKKKQTQS